MTNSLVAVLLYWGSFMKFKFSLFSLLAILAFSSTVNAQLLTGSTVPTSEGDLIIHPVSHASFVMSWNGKTRLRGPGRGSRRL